MNDLKLKLFYKNVKLFNSTSFHKRQTIMEPIVERPCMFLRTLIYLIETCNITKQEIITVINDNIFKGNINLNNTFKQASRQNNYEIMDCMLESNYTNFWNTDIYNWGLCLSCSETNIDSIKYMLSKIKIEDTCEYSYVIEAIKINNKFVLTYLTTVNPYIAILSYKEEDKRLSRNEILINILEKKVKILQQWWKNILYNPHTQIGEKYALKKIDWAFTE